MGGSHLDKFTQVAEAGLLGLGDLADEDEDGVHNRLFVLKPTVLPQHVGEEIHQRTVLLREFEAQRADGLHLCSCGTSL